MGLFREGKTASAISSAIWNVKALSVYQMMEYLATLKKIPKQAQKSEIERCVELVNLSDRLRSRISTLSGGMIRRLGIAQALLGNPEVVLFDEPTAGLDPEERVRFKNVVASRRHQGVTLISTHIVSDVEACCDKILIMNEGKLVTAGSSQQIANLAQGKVYIVPGAQESDLCGSYYTRSRVRWWSHSVACAVICPPTRKASCPNYGGWILMRHQRVLNELRIFRLTLRKMASYILSPMFSYMF